jgi:hypothetical protein
MNYGKRFVVEPGAKVRLDKIHPGFKDKESHKDATPEIHKHVERLANAQYLLYADGSKSLRDVLQATSKRSLFKLYFFNWLGLARLTVSNGSRL